MTVGAWIGRVMAVIVRACARHALVTVALSLVLAVAGAVYSLQHLTFVTAHVQLLPQRERYIVRLKEHFADFGELNDIVVAIAAPSPERARRFATRLDQELHREGAAPRLTYRIDPAWLASRGLLYLSVDELTRLRDRLFDDEEVLAAYAARPTLDQLVDGVNRGLANAIALGFLDLGLDAAGGRDLRFLDAVLDQMTARLDGAPTYTSPWAAAFSSAGADVADAGWFFSADRRLLFMFVPAARASGEFTENRTAVETIRAAVRRLALEFPDVQAGVTGGPTIAADEMWTAFADSNVATLLAFAITLGLLLLAFRGVAAPLLMLAALAVSLAWSLGVITLVIGHLTVFSVMFISIVVGIGIDYGIYVLYRCDEERWLGASLADALERTAQRTGPGVLLGALTAAGTFFVLTLTGFQGIREFGAVSGTAVLASFVAMITLFPALLVVTDRGRREPAAPGAALAGAVALEARWLARATAHRKTILVAAAALSALAVWGAAAVRFDYNMLELQAAGVESVAWEQRILAEASRSGFAALATAATVDELRSKQAAFEALGSVSKVESILMAIPERQPEKITLLRQMAPLLPPVGVDGARALEPARLRASLETLRRRLGIASDAAGAAGPRELRAVRGKLDGLLAKLSAADAGHAGDALTRLQTQVAHDFAVSLAALRAGLAPHVVGVNDVPRELRRRYVGASGRLLMRIHPRVDIWERPGAERFVRELRSVDADVTGLPVMAFEAIHLIRRGYFEGTLYALALVALVTAAVLRSVRGALLALAPLVLGVLWTLGLMRAFGLHFTLANVWALPLIIGAAAEYGLNVYLRFLEGRASGGPTLARSVVLAVVLNGLTTIGGFGSLMVAHHRGIFGLGLLLTIGGVASLLSSLAVLPVLVQLFGAREPS